MKCPSCGKKIKDSLVAAQLGAKGGQTAGDAKRRGSKAYYSRISKLAAEARARNAQSRFDAARTTTSEGGV